jgi:microcystin-dependent protein
MAGIPANIVIIWSGAIVDIPEGWFLCNGQNGTPDLRNRFVVGAGSNYILDQTGGSANAINVSHTHTAAIGSSPNHSHTFTSGQLNSDGSFIGHITDRLGGFPPLGTDGGNSSHSHSVMNSNSTGESGTDKNLPPYYALAYIMKGAD